MINGNFSFLEQKFPSLALLGRKAEEYVYDDSNGSLIKSGMLCENIIGLICAYNNIELFGDKNDTFASRITRLKREGLLVNDQCFVLHHIRKMRNDAVHKGFESVEASKGVLTLIHRVASWFALVYGGIKNVPNFKMPLKNDATERIAQTFVETKIDNTINKKPPLTLRKNVIKDSKKYDDATEKDSLDAIETKLTEQDLEKAKNEKIGSLSDIKERTLRFYNLLDRTESETRVIIDEQLRQVGFEADTENLRYSKGTRPVPGRNMAIAEWPTKPVVKGGSTCYADYALFIGTKLYAFIEAKSSAKDISSVLDTQCRDYASCVRDEDDEYVIDSYGEYKVPFIFSCNGRSYIEQYKEKSGVWFLDLRATNNTPKALHGFMSPQGLEELLDTDTDKAFTRLSQEPYSLLENKSGLNLRYYQIDAIKAIENALKNGKTSALVAMATGTGKTRTILGLIYRMLKTHSFKRILYLVDRNSLGEQTLDVFSDVEIKDYMPLKSIYSINTLEDIKIDKSTKLQIATVQSMVKRILYASISDNTDNSMPGVNDYDLIIIDEAHRGYILDKEMSSDEAYYSDQRDFLSKYRQVVEYFNATKVALTATPALHTVQIFGEPVYEYSYRQAVLDGNLVDFDAPYMIKTKFNQKGIHFDSGEIINTYDKDLGSISKFKLSDELNFKVDDFNRSIIVESFNREVLSQIADRIDPTFSDELGKTLIYAVNDAHADMIVHILKEIYAKRGCSESVIKITGTACDGNQKKIQKLIRCFKNESSPGIVVTVDLLTTGIDVPKITNLVFMRRVKSRILYEQMIGRATRKCDEILKDHFNIYDAVNVTSTFDEFTDVKPVVANPKQSFKDILNTILESDNNPLVNFNVDKLVAKMQRKSSVMDDKAKEQFKALSQGVEFSDFIQNLHKLKGSDSAKEFVKEHENLIKKLDVLKSKTQNFTVITDKVDSFIGIDRSYNDSATRPEDYIEGLRRTLKENKDKIDIIKNICTRPSYLKSSDLKSLLTKLETENYTLVQIKNALHDIHKTDADISYDIITIIRNLLLDEPLVSHKDKVERAFKRLIENHNFLTNELKWLKRIEQFLLNDETAVLTVSSFDEDSRFKSTGGFARIDSQLGYELKNYIDELNSYIYEPVDKI